MNPDFWTWAIPLALYGVSLLHHGWAWRKADLAAHHAARQQQQFEMVREAIALAKYGAIEEAHALLHEAVELT